MEQKTAGSQYPLAALTVCKGGVTNLLIYTVQPGDTVFSIAQSLGSSVVLIQAANRLGNPDEIYPGQQLLVPVLSGTQVRVQPGDSLFGLARRFDLPLDVLAAANNLFAPYTIYPGQVLQVPATLVPAVGCIAFLSSRANGRWDIWARNPSRVGVNRLTFGLGGPASVPYWSPNGQRLAFVGESGELLVLDVATRQARSLVGGLPEFTTLSWSPDSQSLLFSLNGQVIQVNALTGATRLITSGDDPVWLPSGQALLFTREVAPLTEQVFQANLDGSRVRQVTNLREAGNIQNLAVDPRGELVAFTSPGASVSIVYIAEIASGQIRETPPGEQGKDYFPAWSPDGDYLAYNSTIFTESVGFRGRVRLVNRQGAFVGDLTDVACLGERLAWSPDSQYIAFPNCIMDLAQLTLVTAGQLPVQITANGINVHPAWRQQACPIS